jgi:hypothetical protein
MIDSDSYHLKTIYNNRILSSESYLLYYESIKLANSQYIPAMPRI